MTDEELETVRRKVGGWNEKHKGVASEDGITLTEAWVVHGMATLYINYEDTPRVFEFSANTLLPDDITYETIRDHMVQCFEVESFGEVLARRLHRKRL